MTHAQLALGVVISIHALVKRATVLASAFNMDKVISIHALVKRATCNLYDSYVIGLYFNPRPREEGDTGQDIQISHLFVFQSTPS